MMERTAPDSLFVLTRKAAPIAIAVCTAIIFLLDLNFPMGFAPWLPYFVLAFATARLYEPRTLLFATAFWSVAVMGEPLLHSEAEHILAEATFNRTLGVVTLWILTGLLYADTLARRGRQASESRLQAIVEGALDAVVTMDAHGMVVEWNPQAETIFGFSRGEAVGQQLAQLIIPVKYREAHFQGMKRFLTTGQETISRRRIEITAIRKTGEEFPVELTMIPLRLQDQILFSSFIRDIGNRRQDENTLRQTTAFIESLFEHLPNMVFVKDAKDLRFVRFNKAGEELVGRSRSELLGKNDYDFFPQQEADFFTAKDRETLSSGRLVDIPEEPIQTKSKGVRILHTKKIPVCDSSGVPQYLLGISEDVTERKEAEAALVRARQAAEEANKAKSDFLANMSHEMRTPLNAIMGIGDYLARTPLNEDQLALVERCTKASDGLLRMIEDLLLAAKAESGTLALLSEPFVLKKILVECIDLLVNEAQEKDLSLTVDLDPSLPTVVTGDAYRLQQVLLNLIRNAIKFTSAGSIAIHARRRSVEKDVCHVEFTVTDTGIGISDDLRERLFMRFSQADSRANRHYGGVGLGLSICKQLVDLMEGKIFVESTPGKGSAFSFTIPLGTAIESASDAPLHSSTGKIRAFRSTRLLPGRKLKILLAEDCIESQRVMRLYVNKTPHLLDCAETGAAVVESFKTGRYDLVLMDLHMPDMDGCEATRLIRTWEMEQGQPRTPIVALTADGFAESKQKSLDAGCDDFVTKPIKMDIVLGILQRYANTNPSPQPFPLNRPQPPSGDDALNTELRLLKPKFIHNRHRDVSALRTAIDTVNYAEIEIIGHRIKGIAGSYGLHAMGAIGGALERAAKEHRLEHIVASVAQLIEAIKEAEETCSPYTDMTRHNRESKGAAS